MDVVSKSLEKEWMWDVVLRSLEKDWFPLRKISTTTNDPSVNRKMGTGTDREFPGPVSYRDVITPVFILAIHSTHINQTWPLQSRAS